MADHVRVNLRLQPGALGQTPQAAGRRVPVHASAAAGEQDRPAVPGSGCPVDCDRWRQRNVDYFAALAAYAQDPVGVFFAEVGDFGAGGFDDPQT